MHVFYGLLIAVIIITFFSYFICVTYNYADALKDEEEEEMMDDKDKMKDDMMMDKDMGMMMN